MTYHYGLSWSSLTMGVHPGCPVAASLVAVETDVEETISAAKVAVVCGLWSVGVITLLFADRLVGLVVRRPPREWKIPGSNPAGAGIFLGRVIPVTQNLALQWLPCQVPGVKGSALGLVSPVSVCCDWVR